jgi:hypothetical protein
VTCTAIDTANNTNTCSFTVTISATNTPPVLPVQTPRTIGEMTTLLVTNTATDTDLPAQTLTYSLLSPPAGSDINTTNGVITFSPNESFGPAAATITTRVVDNGSPPASATNSFVVTVLDTIAVKLTVVNTNDSGPGSLRQAILTANTNGTILPDFIAFAITNTSHTILLASTVSASQPVVIDGTTQLGAPAPVETVLNPPVEIRGGNFAVTPSTLQLISTTNSLVRGLAISRSAAGFAVVISGGRSNRIESCHIGVGLTGESTNDGNFNAVQIGNSSFNTIGGNLTGQGNVIGNNSSGITLGGDTNTIQGNFIGISRAGNPLGNLNDGIHTASTATGNIIGGTNAGQGNVIAFNGTQGVWNTAATTNTVRGNSIFANVGLGIDLGTTGVTPNDAGDADGFQNYPVIIATVSGGNAVISGVLTSRLAVASYTIDLYTNTVCDPSGYGEGESYLATAVLTTAANGIGSFNLAFPTAALPLGTKLAATATSPTGSTSEFSPCTEVILQPALTVQHSNSVMAVNWSTNASSFRFETTFNLAPPASWQTITTGITANGSSRAFTFTNNAAITDQFFRLTFP